MHALQPAVVIRASLDLTMDLDQLLAECRKLSHHDRARVALELVRDLEGDDDEDTHEGVHEAWTDELHRRWAQVERGEVEPLTREEFIQRVKERREARAR